MKANVTVDGCDDSTSIDLDMTDEQYLFLRAVDDAITTASTYGCMPKMTVTARETETANPEGNAK